jgi:hypothetical protein
MGKYEERLNININNLLGDIKVKCSFCRVEQPYENLDGHEITCGECELCNSKLENKTSIFSHFAEECPKYELHCVACNENFIRSRFEVHDCHPVVV